MIKYSNNNTIRIIVTTFILIIFFRDATAQTFKIVNDKNQLEIGGVLSGYYNYREYTPGITSNLTKNTFKLKDAKLDLNGKIGSDYEYHFQMDFASWGASIDPASPLLDDANFTYKGWRRAFNITIGYGKVPYSLSSLIEHEKSPYWERPQITQGDFFSRRDVGITLQRSFWNKRIDAHVGMYTGIGEAVLGGVNDPSGAFEYIGRLEFSYPEKRKDELVDTRISSTPYFSLGLNGRYSKRNLPVGSTFLPGEVGALLSDTTLNFKVINGEKYILGMDLSVEWKGASVQVETHTLKGKPQNSSDPLFVGLPKNITNGNFNAGGWYAEANYFVKPIKTILSVRYDELNANDLVDGISKHLGGSICYQVKGFASMIKAEFRRNLEQHESINVSKWENEYRIGWQFVLE